MAATTTNVSHTGGGSARQQLGTQELELVIANGGTAAQFMSGGFSRGTFQQPSAFTGATIQPAMSNDGTNFTDSGAAITVTDDETYAIPAAVFAAKFIRLTSASSEGAARSLKIFLKA